MVRITVDTDKDSHHTIQKIIAILQNFASGAPPMRQTQHYQEQSYQAPSYSEPMQNNAPAGSSGYTDMFATMPTSEPVQEKNSYADMFASNPEPTPQPAPAQNTVGSFFNMASSSTPQSTTSISSSQSSSGVFDMFAEEPAPPSSPSTTMTDMFSSPSSSSTPSTTSDSDFPSVFDDYTEEKKEEFSTGDYMKVQEYDE